MYYKKFNDNIRDWFNDDFFYSTFSVDPTEIKQRVTDIIKIYQLLISMKMVGHSDTNY